MKTRPTAALAGALLCAFTAGDTTRFVAIKLSDAEGAPVGISGLHASFAAKR